MGACGSAEATPQPQKVIAGTTARLQRQHRPRPADLNPAPPERAVDTGMRPAFLYPPPPAPMGCGCSTSLAPATASPRSATARSHQEADAQPAPFLYQHKLARFGMPPPPEGLPVGEPLPLPPEGAWRAVPEARTFFSDLDDIRASHKVLDRDADGFLGVDDFVIALGLDRAAVGSVIGQYDKDGDGMLSCPEYAELCRDRKFLNEVGEQMAGPYRMSDFNGKSFKDHQYGVHPLEPKFGQATRTAKYASTTWRTDDIQTTTDPFDDATEDAKQYALLGQWCPGLFVSHWEAHRGSRELAEYASQAEHYGLHYNCSLLDAFLKSANGGPPMSTNIRRGEHGRTVTGESMETVLSRVYKLAERMKAAKLESNDPEVPELLRGLDDSERLVVAGFLSKKFLGCSHQPGGVDGWVQGVLDMQPGEWRWGGHGIATPGVGHAIARVYEKLSDSELRVTSCDSGGCLGPGGTIGNPGPTNELTGLDGKGRNAWSTVWPIKGNGGAARDGELGGALDDCVMHLLHRDVSWPDKLHSGFGYGPGTGWSMMEATGKNHLREIMHKPYNHLGGYEVGQRTDQCSHRGPVQAMHYLWRRSGLSKSQSKEIFQAVRLMIIVQTGERLAAIRAADGCAEAYLSGHGHQTGIGMAPAGPLMSQLIGMQEYWLIKSGVCMCAQNALKLHDRGRMTLSDLRLCTAVCRRVCQLLPHESHYWFPLPPVLSPRAMGTPVCVSGHSGALTDELRRASPWDPSLLGGPQDQAKAAHLNMVKLAEMCSSAETITELRQALAACVESCDWLKAQQADVALNLIHIQNLVHHIFASGALPVPPPEAASIYFKTQKETEAYYEKYKGLPWANLSDYDSAAAVAEYLVQLMCEMAAASASLPFSLEVQALDQVSIGAALSMLDALLMVPLPVEASTNSKIPAILQAGYRDYNLFCTSSSGASFAMTTASCPFTSPEALDTRAQVQKYFRHASTRHDEAGKLFDWAPGCHKSIKELAGFCALHLIGPDKTREFFYIAAENAGLKPKTEQTDNREGGTAPFLMEERIRLYDHFKENGFKYSTDMEILHLPKHPEMGFKLYWACGDKSQNALFAKDPLCMAFRDMHFLFRILMEPHHDNYQTYKKSGADIEPGKRFSADQARPKVHVMGSDGDVASQGICVQAFQRVQIFGRPPQVSMSSIFHPALSGNDSGLELDEIGRKKLSEYQSKHMLCLDNWKANVDVQPNLGKDMEEALLHNGLTEEDIVHAPNLLDFKGTFSQEESELFFTYLTAPTMRASLLLHFFAQNRVQALQVQEIRRVLFAAVLSPGNFPEESQSHERPIDTIPATGLDSKFDENRLRWSVGILHADLTYSPGALLCPLIALLEAFHDMACTSTFTGIYVPSFMDIARLSAIVYEHAAFVLDKSIKRKSASPGAIDDDGCMAPSQAVIDQLIDHMRTLHSCLLTKAMPLVEKWLRQVATRASRTQQRMQARAGVGGATQAEVSTAEAQEDATKAQFLSEMSAKLGAHLAILAVPFRSSLYDESTAPAFLQAMVALNKGYMEGLGGKLWVDYDTGPAAAPAGSSWLYHTWEIYAGVEGYWPSYPDSSQNEPAPLPMSSPETALGSCPLQAPYACLARRRLALFAFFAAQHAEVGTAQERVLTHTVQTAAKSSSISWAALLREGEHAQKQRKQRGMDKKNESRIDAFVQAAREVVIEYEQMGAPLEAQRDIALVTIVNLGGSEQEAMQVCDEVLPSANEKIVQEAATACRPSATLFGPWVRGKLKAEAFRHMTQKDLWIFCSFDDNYLKMVGAKKVGTKTVEPIRCCAMPLGQCTLNDARVSEAYDGANTEVPLGCYLLEDVSAIPTTGSGSFHVEKQQKRIVEIGGKTGGMVDQMWYKEASGVKVTLGGDGGHEVPAFVIEEDDYLIQIDWDAQASYLGGDLCFTTLNGKRYELHGSSGQLPCRNQVRLFARPGHHITSVDFVEATTPGSSGEFAITDSPIKVSNMLQPIVVEEENNPGAGILVAGDCCVDLNLIKVTFGHAVLGLMPEKISTSESAQLVFGFDQPLCIMVDEHTTSECETYRVPDSDIDLVYWRPPDVSDVFMLNDMPQNEGMQGNKTQRVILVSSAMDGALGLDGPKAFVLSTGGKLLLNIVPGLSNHTESVSLQSVDRPDHYLRHAGYKLWLHKNEDSDLYKADASFHIRDRSSIGPRRFLKNVEFTKEDTGEEDVRAGSGGAYMFPRYKWTFDPYEAIRGFALTTGDERNQQGPPGYTKVAQDLNEGAGGSYNYLWVTHEPSVGPPIESVSFLKFDKPKSGTKIGGFNVLPRDILKNGGGKCVYIGYQSASSAVAFESVNYPGHFVTRSKEDSRLTIELCNVLLVAGSGCDYVDGKYERLPSDYGGYPMYKCTHNNLELWRNSGEWRIGRTCDYYYTCEAENPVYGQWEMPKHGPQHTNRDAVPSPPCVSVYLTVDGLEPDPEDLTIRAGLSAEALFCIRGLPASMLTADDPVLFRGKRYGGPGAAFSLSSLRSSVLDSTLQENGQHALCTSSIPGGVVTAGLPSSMSAKQGDRIQRQLDIELYRGLEQSRTCGNRGGLDEITRMERLNELIDTDSDDGIDSSQPTEKATIWTAIWAEGAFKVDQDKIAALAACSSQIWIRTIDDHDYGAKCKPHSWPIQCLRAGKAFSKPATGGDATREKIAEAWEGPDKVLEHLWNTSVADYNVVDPNAMFYHACNNGGGLHLGQGHCGWAWQQRHRVEVLLGAVDVLETWETKPPAEALMDMCNNPELNWLAALLIGVLRPEMKGVTRYDGCDVLLPRDDCSELSEVEVLIRRAAAPGNKEGDPTGHTTCWGVVVCNKEWQLATVYWLCEMGREVYKHISYTSNATISHAGSSIPRDVSRKDSPPIQIVENAVGNVFPPEKMLGKLSVLVSRNRMNSEQPHQLCLPESRMRGLIPDCLVDNFTFWKSPAESSSAYHATDFSAQHSQFSTIYGERRPGSDVERYSYSLHITITESGPLVERIEALSAQRMMLFDPLKTPNDLQGFANLISRLEDLSYVLIWLNSDNVPCVAELPRLGMTFRVGAKYDNRLRWYCEEHDGYFLLTDSDGSAETEKPCSRIEKLCASIPYYVLLGDHTGHTAVLVNSCPLRTVTLSQAPWGQFWKACRSDGAWLSAKGPRSYMYKIHTSRCWLEPSSIGAALYLTHCFMIHRRWQEGMLAAKASSTDLPLGDMEKLLLQLIDDNDPSMNFVMRRDIQRQIAVGLRNSPTTREVAWLVKLLREPSMAGERGNCPGGAPMNASECIKEPFGMVEAQMSQDEYELLEQAASDLNENGAEVMGPESRRVRTGPEYLDVEQSGVGTNGMEGWQHFCQSGAPKCVLDEYRQLLSQNDLYFSGSEDLPRDHRGCRCDIFGHNKCYYDLSLRNNGQPITGDALYGKNGVLQKFVSDAYNGISKKAGFLWMYEVLTGRISLDFAGRGADDSHRLAQLYCSWRSTLGSKVQPRGKHDQLLEAMLAVLASHKPGTIPGLPDLDDWIAPLADSDQIANALNYYKAEKLQDGSTGFYASHALMGEWWRSQLPFVNGCLPKPKQEVEARAISAGHQAYVRVNGHRRDTKVVMDHETDGGGWILLCAYRHKGGENEDLRNEHEFPLSATEGYAHNNAADLPGCRLEDISEARFYGQTSAHSRKIHFKTSAQQVLQLIFDGTGDIKPSSWTTGFTTLEGHSANLPGSCTHCDGSNGAGMTNFPFYVWGSAHWSIRGHGSRWEVDDYCNNCANSTLHQIWVRLKPARTEIRRVPKTAKPVLRYDTPHLGEFFFQLLKALALFCNRGVEPKCDDKNEGQPRPEYGFGALHWSTEWPNGSHTHSAQVDIGRGDGSQWNGAVKPTNFSCPERTLSTAHGASERDLSGFALYPLSSIQQDGLPVVRNSLDSTVKVPDSNVESVIEALTVEESVAAAEHATAQLKTSAPLSDTIPVPTHNAEMQSFIGLRTMERVAQDLLEYELSQQRHQRLEFDLAKRCIKADALIELIAAFETQLSADQYLLHDLVTEIEQKSHQATRAPHGNGTSDGLPTPYSGSECRVRYLLAQSAWKETTNITPCYAMAAALSSEPEIHMRKANPFISHEAIDEIVHSSCLVYYYGSRVSLTRRVLGLVKRALKTLQAAGPEAESTQKACKTLAQWMGTKRHFGTLQSDGSLSFDPRLLCFEFVTGFVLRKRQVQLAKNFEALVNGGGSQVEQMLMGEGKTAVIAPLAFLLMSDNKRRMTLACPKALLEMSRAVLWGVFGACPLLPKEVMTFQFSRSSDQDVTPLKILRSRLDRAASQGGIVVTQPTAIKSLLLKYIELGFKRRQINEANNTERAATACRPSATLFGPWVRGKLKAEAFRHMTQKDLWIFCSFDDNYLKMVGAKKVGTKTVEPIRCCAMPLGQCTLNDARVSEAYDGANTEVPLGCYLLEDVSAIPTTGSGSFHDKLDQQIELLEAVLGNWRSHGVLIMDEVDVLLNPLKSELNFPVGPKNLIDVGGISELRQANEEDKAKQAEDQRGSPGPVQVTSGVRWDLPLYLLDTLYDAHAAEFAAWVDGKQQVPTTAELGNDGLKHILALALRNGRERRVIQSTPHLVLLDTQGEWFTSELQPLFARVCFRFLSNGGYINPRKDAQAAGPGPMPTEQELEAYICIPYGNDVEDGVKNRLEFHLTPFGVQLLNLARMWVTLVGPHVLAKVHRVSYGLLLPHHFQPGMPLSRKLLGVPFVALEQPSPAAEFAHMDVSIGVTLLSYKVMGLRDRDLKQIVTSLKSKLKQEPGPMDSRSSNIQWHQWLQAAIDAIVRANPERNVSDFTIIPLESVQLNEEEHWLMLKELLPSFPPLIRFYLRTHVFPVAMRGQDLKLTTSGQALGSSMLFASRIGFSGTPSDLLPQEGDEHRQVFPCRFEPGSEGRILSTLTDPCICSSLLLPTEWNVLRCLDVVAQQQNPHFDALIDAGALIVGMSNLDVARYLLKSGLEWAQGCVFLDENDEQMILMRGSSERIVRLKESGLPWNKRFTFYDQVHTTGMDIKQHVRAVAAITVSKDTTYRDYAQGCYRMRGISAGQQLRLLLTPEVLGLMKRDLGQTIQASTPSSVVMESAVAWLLFNNVKTEGKQMLQLIMQNIDTTHCRKALSKLLPGGEASADAEANSRPDDARWALADLFLEHVSHAIPTCVPKASNFIATLNERVAERNALVMLDKPDLKVIQEMLSLANGEIANKAGAEQQEKDMDASAEKEAELESEKEQEKESEKESQREAQREAQNWEATDRDLAEPCVWSLAKAISQGFEAVDAFYDLTKFRIREQVEKSSISSAIKGGDGSIQMLDKITAAPLLSRNFADCKFESPLARRLRPLNAVLVSPTGKVVALSLQEAESVKRCIAEGRSEGAQRLQMLHKDGWHLALGASSEGMFDEMEFQMLRFFDTEFDYTDEALERAQQALGAHSPTERLRFFEQNLGCKRREGMRWQSTPVRRLLSMTKQEWDAINQLRVQVMDALAEKRMDLVDLCRAIDRNRDGELHPEEIFSFLVSMNGMPSADRLKNLVQLLVADCDVSPCPGSDLDLYCVLQLDYNEKIDYKEFIAFLTNCNDPSQALVGNEEIERMFVRAQNMAQNSVILEQLMSGKYKSRNDVQSVITGATMSWEIGCDQAYELVLAEGPDSSAVVNRTLYREQQHKAVVHKKAPGIEYRVDGSAEYLIFYPGFPNGGEAWADVHCPWGNCFTDIPRNGAVILKTQNPELANLIAGGQHCPETEAKTGAVQTSVSSCVAIQIAAGTDCSFDGLHKLASDMGMCIPTSQEVQDFLGSKACPEAAGRDVWSPSFDQPAADWIQIGDACHPPGKSHAKHHGYPGWAADPNQPYTPVAIFISKETSPEVHVGKYSYGPGHYVEIASEGTGLSWGQCWSGGSAPDICYSLEPTNDPDTFTCGGAVCPGLIVQFTGGGLTHQGTGGQIWPKME